ncbi:hypothetical protein D3C86_1953900 [compost metagenome]
MVRRFFTFLEGLIDERYTLAAGGGNTGCGRGIDGVFARFQYRTHDHRRSFARLRRRNGKDL